VVIGRSRFGFTTVSVSSFGFDAESDADPERPLRNFSGSSYPV
jgi:hypothetical protein